MPDYECECQETSTVHQTIAEHEATLQQKCPSCKSPNAIQALPGAAITTSTKH